MTKESMYVIKRIAQGKIQSIWFYLFRIFKVKERKIVFTCIEGTTGYSCNPKYIAEEFIKYNNTTEEKYELFWLVNDITKAFPQEINVVKNTLINRAYHLSTAKFWIDNSRKQLECRKRSDQIYIQTWHAKLGFKPTCLDRGKSFSKIAYLVSKHDSDMVDYWLSNSDWYDNTLKTGSLYEGKVLRTGSPRCDILVEVKNDETKKRKIKRDICIKNGMEQLDIDKLHFLMYAPTFRGGSQSTDRVLDSDNHYPDFELLRDSLEKKFGGKWIFLLRLHPQMVVRGAGTADEKAVIDISKEDDMYEILAGCDAFMTDYSSAAFDATVLEIPVILFCDDLCDYEDERGNLLWNMESLPFVFAQNNEELNSRVLSFDNHKYLKGINKLNDDAKVVESGKASKMIVDFISANITSDKK